MKRADGSWDPFDDYVLDFSLERMRAGEKVALVTLVEIEGSSPRPLGAQMAVSESGRWVGYLSGGCIERAIAAEAEAALAEGRSRRVRYGRGSRYIDISLPCGSAIELVFDVDVPLAEIEAIDKKLRARRPARMKVPLLDPADPEAWLERPYQPRRRLAVFGIGPVAVQLSRLALAAGFEVALHSPDEATVEAARAVDTAIGSLYEVDDLAAAGIDAWTAIAFVFHDHDRESRLVPAALATDAFYIGAMGSHETHRLRLERLKAQGFDERQLRRIKGPAGLLPRARSASDIALSILAEAVDAERQAKAEAPAPEIRSGAMGPAWRKAHGIQVEAHL